ncbi:DUF6344 domain-containing protein [Streptomyces sp. NPDC056411]|uniref:DUF6344 domain-containing protein n=1 Tax=Streptomyces sp. NPDC056411 TaxID=3345813 RepID=UPI0035DCAF39
MAATKVMKFWAVCLAVLGKLLASLGVSAPASAARREAALYERGPANGTAGADAPGAEVPKAVHGAERERDPDAGSPAVPAGGGATPGVPAPRSVPQFGCTWPARRTLTRPELPPTIKQRISAEAHGTSPGLRSRGIRGLEPLTTDAASHEDGEADARAGAEADAHVDAYVDADVDSRVDAGVEARVPAPASSSTPASARAGAEARQAVIPAARRRAHTAGSV